MTWRGVAQSYDLRFVDGSVTRVDTSLQDALRWESNHKGQPYLSGGMPGFGQMLETCFYALRRTGEISETDRAAWQATVVDLRVVGDDEDDEDDPMGPTNPDQSDDG